MKRSLKVAGEKPGHLIRELIDDDFDFDADSPAGEFEYEIARLAWEEGLSSNTILERKQLPKTAQQITKIRRALEKAVRHGLLELRPPRKKELEDSLKKEFPDVAEIRVQIDRNAACLKAAMLVKAEVEQFLDGPKERMVIANAGGRTVRDITRYLERLVPLPPYVEKGKRLVFLSLNAAEAHDSFDQCANFLSVRMAQIYASEQTSHFALVKPWDETTGTEYRKLLSEISLLITSAGGRVGFLSHWLSKRNRALPRQFVGDVALHLIDRLGIQVEMEPDVAKELSRAPDWQGLMQLFIRKKVLVVLAGDKLEIARALLGSALAQRCVLDRRLAEAILRSRAQP
jgi:DNA-binding transcriptional regulator LsrR (DeoR family)